MTSNTLTTEKTSYLPEGLPMPAAQFEAWLAGHTLPAALVS